VIDETLDVTIRLMISTGLRVGEVCRLRVEDVSPDGLSLRVHGKGSRDRVAYVSDTTLRADLSKIFKRRRIDAGSIAALDVFLVDRLPGLGVHHLLLEAVASFGIDPVERHALAA